MFDKIRQYFYLFRMKDLIKKYALFLLWDAKRKNDSNEVELDWRTERYQCFLKGKLYGYKPFVQCEMRIGDDNYVVFELVEARGVGWLHWRYTRLHLGDWTEDFIAYGKDAMRQRKREINERFEPFEHVQEIEPSDLDEIFQAPHEDEVHTLEK